MTIPGFDLEPEHILRVQVCADVRQGAEPRVIWPTQGGLVCPILLLQSPLLHCRGQVLGRVLDCWESFPWGVSELRDLLLLGVRVPPPRVQQPVVVVQSELVLEVDRLGRLQVPSVVPGIPELVVWASMFILTS